MIAARRIINSDDPAIGHVFNDRCRSSSSEFPPKGIAQLSEALRKTREGNRIADTRHWWRPSVSEINHASETLRRLFLRHPKCRKIELRIAIDQRASKVQASRPQHRYDLARLVFGAFERSDYVVCGNPDQAVTKPKNKAGCSA